MQWTHGQEIALDRAAQWLRSPERQEFRLFGYAGTGKTTLARHLAEGVDGPVVYLAPTGKAALVLRNAGCAGATTIHSAIYHSKDRSKQRLRELEESLMELRHEIRSENPPDYDVDEHPEVRKLQQEVRAEKKNAARPAFTLNPDAELRDAALIVVDEWSMVDEKLGSDLLSFDRPVLTMGDPAQLPPVGGNAHSIHDKPDAMLEEITRNAAGNPIIRIATAIREEQRRPSLGQYGESMVLPRERLDADLVLGHEQLLVGRNKTRRASNRRVRSLLGRDDALPSLGDKLVCLRNNHDLGLLNGAIWHCVSSEDLGDRIGMDLRSDDGDSTQTLVAHKAPFLGDDIPWWERKEAEEFDYGNALTCHKAQGSQFTSVLLLDESRCFRKDWWRWLYTGVTRAIDRVTLVDMGE